MSKKIKAAETDLSSEQGVDAFVDDIMVKAIHACNADGNSNHCKVFTALAESSPIQMIDNGHSDCVRTAIAQLLISCADRMGLTPDDETVN